MTGPYGNRFIIAIAIVVVLAVVLTRWPTSTGRTGRRPRTSQSR